MKRKTRVFSTLLALILVLVSVPMTVCSEDVSKAENPEQIADSQIENVTFETDFPEALENFEMETLSDNLIESQDGIETTTLVNDFSNIKEDVYYATSTVSSTTQQITGLPDGIYAFETYGSSDRFMKVQRNSTEPGARILISYYDESPTLSGLIHATFRVTKVKNTDNRYIIRLMSNENLTFAFDGTNVITKEIPANDIDVSIQDTFYITRYSNLGYTIQPYSSNDYISANTNLSATTPGILNNFAVWIPRGYRTYIEDGVYMFANRGNSGLCMDTQENSYKSGKHAQQYAYASAPTSTFSRGGLFKIKQVGNMSGQYVIRLMTNNFLTWGSDSGNNVISKITALNDSDVTDDDLYYIVYDDIGFMLVPCSKNSRVISALPNTTASGSVGVPDSYLRLVQRATATASARWNMYKYTGEERGKIVIAVPDELIEGDPIVGERYTISPIVWNTNSQTDLRNVYMIDGNITNVATLIFPRADETMLLAINNPGHFSFRITLGHINSNNNMVYDKNAIYNYNAILSESIYYIQNKYSNKYANIRGPSQAEGEIIHQHEYFLGSQAKWQVEHVEGESGYIRFKSLYSNLYMGVDLSSPSEIRQYESTGDNTLWKVESLGNYAVKIICKASESSGTVLATPSDRDGNGEWLTQRAYTNDDNYSDEWIVSTNRYQFYIDHYYDVGYSVRFDSTGQDIYEYQSICSEVLSQLFDVEIIYTISAFNSCADICTGTPITLAKTTTICTHSNINHKMRYNIINDIVSNFGSGDETLGKIVWTGHMLESRSSGLDPEQNIVVITIGMATDESCNNLSTDIVRYQRIHTLLHEISHQLGAPDHYCYDENSSNCDNPTNDCWRCDNNLNDEPVCIMSSRINDIEDRLLTGDLETLYCSQCKSSTHLKGILTHLEDHH